MRGSGEQSPQRQRQRKQSSVWKPLIFLLALLDVTPAAFYSGMPGCALPRGLGRTREGCAAGTLLSAFSQLAKPHDFWAGNSLVSSTCSIPVISAVCWPAPEGWKS